MNRYEWPEAGARSEAKDDPGGRAGYNARRRSGEADALARVLLRESAAAADARPRGLRPRAPASTDTLLWQPLGPSVLLGGQAEGKPRVTGRVNALAIHPAGQRAYAASANGGVWATTDGGEHWQSVAGLASTNIAGMKRPAHRNVSAALHVLWRDPPAGNEIVFMGTGEPHKVREGRPGNAEDGLGIFVADQPLSSAADDPWRREAKNLVNDIVYAIASSPDGSTVVAATATGLYQRPVPVGSVPAPPDADWTLVAGMPAAANGAKCTSVLWTPGDPAATAAAQRRPERLWVWIEDGINNGLWVRDGSAAGAVFVQVAVDAANSAFGFVPERAELAALPPPSVPNVVWLLQDLGGGSSGLFRISNPKPADAAPPRALAVEGVPDLFHDTGWYNLAIAVDPSNENRVALAGNYLGVPGVAADADLLTTVDGAVRSYDAAIVLDTVVANPLECGTAGVRHPAARGQDDRDRRAPRRARTGLQQQRREPVDRQRRRHLPQRPAHHVVGRLSRRESRAVDQRDQLPRRQPGARGRPDGGPAGQRRRRATVGQRVAGGDRGRWRRHRARAPPARELVCAIHQWKLGHVRRLRPGRPARPRAEQQDRVRRGVVLHAGLEHRAHPRGRADRPVADRHHAPLVHRRLRRHLGHAARRHRWPEDGDSACRPGTTFRTTWATPSMPAAGRTRTRRGC